MDHVGRSCSRGLGPFLETGGEDGAIEEVKLGLCSTAGGGSKPGSVVLSRLLDRTLGDVRVVVVELIERRSCQGVDVGESGLGPYKDGLPRRFASETVYDVATLGWEASPPCE